MTEKFKVVDSGSEDNRGRGVDMVNERLVVMVVLNLALGVGVR